MFPGEAKKRGAGNESELLKLQVSLNKVQVSLETV